MSIRAVMYANKNPARQKSCVKQRLELGSGCRLSWKQKCLWVTSLATELERTEILVPETLRHFRFRFQPETELIQIIQADLSVMHALDQMLANGLRQPRPRFNLWHYSPKMK